MPLGFLNNYFMCTCISTTSTQQPWRPEAGMLFLWTAVRNSNDPLRGGGKQTSARARAAGDLNHQVLAPAPFSAFWHRILLCCLGFCSSHRVLEFFIRVPQPLKCVPPCHLAMLFLYGSFPFPTLTCFAWGGDLPQPGCGGQRTVS